MSKRIVVPLTDTAGLSALLIHAPNGTIEGVLAPVAPRVLTHLIGDHVTVTPMMIHGSQMRSLLRQVPVWQGES